MFLLGASFFHTQGSLENLFTELLQTTNIH